MIIPGQLALLQLSEFSLADPSELQLFPPFCGVGLSQLRDFLRVPPPHVAEQEPQAPHGPQAPSTFD